MDPPIKVQIVSRELPIENVHGSATYVLDFIRYLRQAGCEIEFTLLDASPNGKIPWYQIPAELASLTKVSVKDNVQIGRVRLRLNSLSDWWIEGLRLIYDRLPEAVKTVYRSVRDKQRWQPTWHVAEFQLTGTLATPEEIAFASSQFIRFKPDVVIVNYAALAAILTAPSLDQTALKVILTHDVLHQRTAHFKRLTVTSFESEWSRETEAAELNKAQVLLAIQQEDAKVFQEMVPNCKVFCMPISAVCHSHSMQQVPGRCLFVGSHTSHNLHGLQWFLSDAWPIVLQQFPQAHLHVCGTVCYGINQTFPNVSFLGRVPDLQLEYSQAEVCLVPLLTGSGLKIKLVQALSQGRACVSTHIGVQGLPEIAGQAVFVADSAENFAAAVHTILTNPAKRQWMEQQAYSYVAAKFSPEAVYRPFVDYLHQHLQRISNCS